MSLADLIIADARSQLGKPYRFAEEGPDFFDCSGLTQWAYGRHGIRLPRVSADQAKVGRTVAWEEKQPGDLIFSTWDGSPDVDHVGIYIGGNQYLHAPKPGDVVKISTFGKNYRAHVTNVQRVIPDGGMPQIPGPPAIPTPGTPGGGGGGGSLIDAISGVASGIQTIAGGAVSVGGLAAQLGKLFLPSNAMRAIMGGLGTILLFAGIFVITRQVRE